MLPCQWIWPSLLLYPHLRVWHAYSLFPDRVLRFLLHIILVGTVLLYKLFYLALTCIPVTLHYEFIMSLEAVAGILGGSWREGAFPSKTFAPSESSSVFLSRGRLISETRGQETSWWGRVGVLWIQDCDFHLGLSVPIRFQISFCPYQCPNFHMNN